MAPSIEDLMAATPDERERMRRVHRGLFLPLFDKVRAARRAEGHRTPTHRGAPRDA